MGRVRRRKGKRERWGGEKGPEDKVKGGNRREARGGNKLDRTKSRHRLVQETEEPPLHIPPQVRAIPRPPQHTHTAPTLEFLEDCHLHLEDLLWLLGGLELEGHLLASHQILPLVDLPEASAADLSNLRQERGGR